MKIADCYLSGFRRVGQFPSFALWIYFASLLLALPLGLAMREALTHSIGGSLVNESLRRGFDMDWYGEFSATASGIGETFGPSVVGILPILTNLEKLLDGSILVPQNVTLLAGTVFLLVWAFFSGGIIAGFARPDEPTERRLLFGDSALYFFRFVRILIISILLYLALFYWVASPLNRLIERPTRDVAAEWIVMIYTIALYGITALGVLLIMMLADYAKIAMVCETRSSAVLAFIRGARFAFANAAKAFGLFLSIMMSGIVLVGIYWLIAPGTREQVGTTVVLAFLVGQIYIISRIVLKLWFLSSQTELFRSSLGVSEAARGQRQERVQSPAEPNSEPQDPGMVAGA
jgi:hypothetical protein